MSKLYEALPGLLLPWYRENARTLPWRNDKEPYHVWLSEIMLQQTRVEAVKGYYTRFLQALPTIQALAQAPEDLLTKLWEGLGYYTRVRNLQKAAKVIVTEHHGVFPRSYEKVRALPGIGDYTAGAVCSICFDLPTAAVDGNVLRVISRLEASYAPIDQLATKRDIAAKLAVSYRQGSCGDLTQSLMELGATVCVPIGQPDCLSCPCSQLCQAKKLGCQGELPVKARKKARKEEEKTVFLLLCQGQVAVVKRPEKGLLAGLWSYPHVDGLLTAQEAVSWAEDQGCCPKEVCKVLKKVHIFTHVQWTMQGIYLVCQKRPGQFRWVDKAQLETEVGLPTAFRQFSQALEEPEGISLWEV